MANFRKINDSITINMDQVTTIADVDGSIKIHFGVNETVEVIGEKAAIFRAYLERLASKGAQ